MRIIGIIPARLGSSRFPNKPMKKILEIPMIGHVYFRSKMSKTLTEVYIATPDKEIYDYIVSIGGKAVMTSQKHERASDRIAEALLKIEKTTKQKTDIVVMLQGDEPMINPQMIKESVTPLVKNNEINITNLLGTIKSNEEFEDGNQIKVVIDKDSNAIYFSREPIPSRKKYKDKIDMYKQVCVIAFRRNYLLHYTKMKPTPLEIIESIDMLRILENGEKIKMVPTHFSTHSVDTEEDLIKVSKLMENDALIKKYNNVN